jgi:hypothetical protein
MVGVRQPPRVVVDTKRYGVTPEERAELLWLLDAVAIRVASRHPLPLVVRDAKDERNTLGKSAIAQTVIFSWTG